MAKLKITFEQMFLLVRSEAEPVVLLPKGWDDMVHDLYALGRGVRLRICGADLSICSAASQEAALGGDCELKKQGMKPRWPNPDWVLYANNLHSSRPPTVRKNLLCRKTPVSPGEINARLWLPPGTFGWNWNMSDFGDARWQVGPDKDRHQWLTDIMTFECEVADDVSHFLKIGLPANTDLVALQKAPGDDIDLTFYNRDRPTTRTGHVPFGTRTDELKDFAVIFELFEKTASPLPLPKYYGPGPTSTRPPGGRTPRVIHGATRYGACDAAARTIDYDILSDTDPERPICGGAQGDPP